MIITINSHGKTRRDTANYLAHVTKEVGQTVELIGWKNVVARSPEEALRGFELLRDASRADVAFQSLTINPSRCLTLAQWDQTFAWIDKALGAAKHGRLTYQHNDKERAIADRAPHHRHMALAHVRSDLRGLDLRGACARLEAVARILEYDWGEELTPTRRHEAVAAAARSLGRAEVAEAVLARMPEDPRDLPRSAMSSRTRARAARHGIDLPKERARIAEAYHRADGGKAARAGLEALGFQLMRGDKDDVWLVMKDGIALGALDRLVKGERAIVAARMAEPVHDVDPTPADMSSVEEVISVQGEAKADQVGSEVHLVPPRSEAPLPLADAGEWARSDTANNDYQVVGLTSADASPQLQASGAGPQSVDHSGPSGGRSERKAVGLVRHRDHSREPPEARQPILGKAADPSPVSQQLAEAKAELRFSTEALAWRARDVRRLKADLDKLQEDAPGGFFVKWSRAGKRHQDMLEEAAAALAEAEKGYAAVERDVHDAKIRVKELTDDSARKEAQHQPDPQPTTHVQNVLEPALTLASNGWGTLREDPSPNEEDAPGNMYMRF